MVSIDDLASEITKALQEYTNEVTEALEKEKEKAAKDAAKELRNTSPKQTGEYAKGWKAKRVGNAWVTYNSKKPQLTHLLEHGHVKRGGGRVSGRPHIGPVEERAIKAYEEGVVKVIRG